MANVDGYPHSFNRPQELSLTPAALKRMRSRFSWLLLLPSLAMAEQVQLHSDKLAHIHFRRIQPTQVTYHDDIIQFDVNRSASFLLLAFDDVRTIRSIAFEWQAQGMLNKHSAAEEKTRKGDDAWLRVGLLISGQPDPVPEALLPRWLQQLRKKLQHPSDRMVYLVPGAMHAAGESWKSPFSSSVDMISVASKDLQNGWKQVLYRFPRSQQAVGLWLMADGDNTASVFSSRLRRLVLD